MAEGVSTCLTLKEVENELREVTEWHCLGVQLGIMVEKLEEIERNHFDSHRRKVEVVNHWLRNADNISWNNLAEAVKAVGGHSHLVQKLNKRHRMQLKGNSSDSDAADEPRAHTNDTINISQSALTKDHILEQPSTENVYCVFKTEDLVPGCRGIKVDEWELKIETRDLRAKFNVLFTLVQRALDSKGVQVLEFVRFLKRVPAYTTNERSLFHALIPQLSVQEDLSGVFDIVADYCSWFNYSLLIDIITTYSIQNEDVKRTKDEFVDQLQSYCKHRVCNCAGSLKNGFGFGRKKDVAHVTIKIDEDWSIISVEQLEEVAVNLAKILKLRRHTLYLRSVEKGCVRITFFIPEFVAKELLHVSSEQQAELSGMKTVQLLCENDNLWCSSHHEVQFSVPDDLRKPLKKSHSEGSLTTVCSASGPSRSQSLAAVDTSKIKVESSCQKLSLMSDAILAVTSVSQTSGCTSGYMSAGTTSFSCSHETCSPASNSSSDEQHNTKLVKMMLDWLQKQVYFKDCPEFIRFNSQTNLCEERKLLCSGNLYQHRKKRFVILLTDMLLILPITKAHKSVKFRSIEWFGNRKYIIKRPLQLRFLTVAQHITNPQDQLAQEEMLLYYETDAKVKEIRLVASSIDDRKSWVEQICSAVMAYNTAYTETLLPIEPKIPCGKSYTKLTVHILRLLAVGPIAGTQLYCALTAGSKKCRTPVTSNIQLLWNFACQILDFSRNDVLLVELYSEKLFCPDDLIGSVKVQLVSLPEAPVWTQVSLQLLSPKHSPIGDLVVQIMLGWETKL